MSLEPTSNAAGGKNFFGRLFDFSFSEFITGSVIRFVYMLLVVLSGLGALAFLIGGLARGGGAAIGALVFAPIAFLVYVLLARIWLEVLIVIFRIAENTEEIARHMRGRDSG
ncbi:MAG: DUF4282 domain-containing protein [Dehalococcoidia bacterium]